MTTILIIEDIAIIQKLLVRVALRTVPSAHIITAHNGEDGIQKVIENRLDLVITGLTMPQMDGYEVVQYLRERYGYRIPIIGLSGIDPQRSRVIHFRELCDDFLAKPFLPSELQTKIHSLLRHRGSRQRISYRYFLSQPVS